MYQWIDHFWFQLYLLFLACHAAEINISRNSRCLDMTDVLQTAVGFWKGGGRVRIVYRNRFLSQPVSTSVADPVFLGHPDPDPDPGKYRIRILYPENDPCNYNFLVIKNCLKYSFIQIIFYL